MKDKILNIKIQNSKIKNYIMVCCFILFVFVPSLILGFHNATLYQPAHGFDGAGHLDYLRYVYKNWQMPPPALGWETHQSPLYYFVGAGLMIITKTWKIAQYMNTVILWLLIGVSGLGLYRVFNKTDQVLIGMLALAGLPMLNIFPAMLTNELLNTFWIVSVAVAGLYLVSAKTPKQIIGYFFWLLISMVAGVWTKISIVMVVPTLVAVFIQLFLQKKKWRKLILGLSLIGGLLAIGLSWPIIYRSTLAVGPSNLVKMAQTGLVDRSPYFYYRLDWIPKVDMYNTQYYSMLGGAWNSFWSDGHNALTPFVKFHKKAFILWTLGFILLPICLFGLWKMTKRNQMYIPIIYVLGLSMVLAYVYYNAIGSHYSSARLTYEAAIVLPYVFGLSQAAENKKVKLVLIFLLLVQFAVMVSFFWILPWWHVTK